MKLRNRDTGEVRPNSRLGNKRKLEDQQHSGSLEAVDIEGSISLSGASTPESGRRKRSKPTPKKTTTPQQSPSPKKKPSSKKNPVLQKSGLI